LKTNGTLTVAFATSLLALLSACGGGNPGHSGPNATGLFSPDGIWNGTESVSGLQITGLIDSGNLRFIRSDGVQYVGYGPDTHGVSGFTAAVEGFTPFGSTWSDGSSHGTGMFSGTMQAKVSASLTVTFTTDAGTGSTGTFNLTFNSLYDVPSALSTIAGNYTDPKTGTVVTINSDGSVFAQDANTGCEINGTVSIKDPTHNVYGIQVSYQSCTGSSAVLNGAQFSGLATLNNSVSPEQILAGLSGQSGATKYAIVYTLNHS
jgi:hypothetical protein